jgi:hypothetical protein
MGRVAALLLTIFIASVTIAGDVTHVVGEVESITTRHENLTPQKALSPLDVDYVLVQLVDGKKYQLPPSLKGMTSSTVVELDISSHKTKSGYPLVVSGRTLSLVATINGKRSVLPLDKPMEFYEKQSNQ